MVSEVECDGMALELTDLEDAAGAGPVIEAFWDDSEGRFDFVVRREATLPFSVVERFVQSARRRLPRA